MLSIPITADPTSGGVLKRRSSRQRIETLVYADLGPGNGGFPINVSEGGMAFQGIQPLEKDQVICIKFKLPGTNELVGITGQVVWLNDLGKGGGLQFIDLPEESRHLISHWFTLQTQSANQNESVPASSRQGEKKELGSAPPLPPAAHQSNATPVADTNSIVPLSRPVLSSVMGTKVTSENKSTAGFLRLADTKQPMFRGTDSKRAWIMPFTIGLISSWAIIIAIMVIFGVISVQFRWPQRTTGENLARPVTEHEAAKAPALPIGKSSINESMAGRLTPGPAALTVPSATSTRGPTGEPAVQRLTASEPSSAKTTTPPKINSPKTSLQKVATAKPIAPSPMTHAGPAEFVPPAFALPTKLEQVSQFPMISSQATAPAPPVSVPARQGGKFDAPQLITRKDPVYPMVAKTGGISGSVELHFTISAEGNVRDVSVVNGNSVLARAAVEAVQAWHYKPARLGGIPIETQSTTVFNFRPN